MSSPSRPDAKRAVDSMTILFCVPGCGASKTIRAAPDGTVKTVGFSAGKHFGALVQPVDGITSLSELLTELERTPNAFTIRGAPIAEPDARGRYLRRKTHFATPAKGRHWVMIDFDKLPLPDGLNLASDPKAAVEHLVSRLPEECRGVSYHYQLSSSAGIGDPRKASAHVWYWLEAPCTDAELKRWAKAVNDKAGCKLVDPALFNDVQPHYTAAPVFEGVPDPFPERSGLAHKRLPAAKLRIPRIKRESARGIASGQAAERSLGFEGRLARIGDHEGGDGFHEPIIRACASYVAQNGRAKVDREALYEIVRARVLAADRSKHDEAYVEHMASREHLLPAIDGALERFGDRPASSRRSRLVPDVAAQPRGPSLGSEEAYRELSDVLDTIIGGAKT